MPPKRAKKPTENPEATVEGVDKASEKGSAKRRKKTLDQDVRVLAYTRRKVDNLAKPLEDPFARRQRVRLLKAA